MGIIYHKDATEALFHVASNCSSLSRFLSFLKSGDCGNCINSLGPALNSCPACLTVLTIPSTTQVIEWSACFHPGQLSLRCPCSLSLRCRNGTRPSLSSPHTDQPPWFLRTILAPDSTHPLL